MSPLCDLHRCVQPKGHARPDARAAADIGHPDGLPYWSLHESPRVRAAVVVCVCGFPCPCPSFCLPLLPLLPLPPTGPRQAPLHHRPQAVRLRGHDDRLQQQQTVPHLLLLLRLWPHRTLSVLPTLLSVPASLINPLSAVCAPGRQQSQGKHHLQRQLCQVHTGVPWDAGHVSHYESCTRCSAVSSPAASLLVSVCSSDRIGGSAKPLNPTEVDMIFIQCKPRHGRRLTYVFR